MKPQKKVKSYSKKKKKNANDHSDDMIKLEKKKESYTVTNNGKLQSINGMFCFY